MKLKASRIPSGLLPLGAALLLSGPVSPSAENGFAIDPALVQSLVDAPEGLMTEHPYLVHFRKGSLNLYYVSANHENRMDSETFGVIRRAFKRFPIKRVVVEGRPYEAGEVSRERVERIIRDSSRKALPWGETDYAIMLAWRKGVRAVGGEPTQKDQFKVAREMGFDTRDYLADGFVKMIPAYRRQGRLAKEHLSSLYAETSKWDRSELGLTDDVEFDYQDFLRWYRDKMGKEFDPANVTHATTKPDPKGTYLQRQAEATNMVRNRFLANVISRELVRYKHVLVVYGNGHHAVQRKAIEAAMGQPVYQGP